MLGLQIFLISRTTSARAKREKAEKWRPMDRKQSALTPNPRLVLDVVMTYECHVMTLRCLTIIVSLCIATRAILISVSHRSLGLAIWSFAIFPTLWRKKVFALTSRPLASSSWCSSRRTSKAKAAASDSSATRASKIKADASRSATTSKVWTMESQIYSRNHSWNHSRRKRKKNYSKKSLELFFILWFKKSLLQSSLTPSFN